MGRVPPGAQPVGLSLAQALAQFQPGLPLAVAFSGGADSTALLLACAQRWPGQVLAIHVHHGLQDAADDFEQHCRDFCARHAIALRVSRVDARHAPGQSPEEAARRARYDALVSVLADPALPLAARDVALAQHADDQVETLLLALSRGAGLPGLSAMPARWQRQGLQFHRPLLAVPGAELRRWLHAQGVDWIEDPSNTDAQFTRNRIRTQLLPVLETAFPQFRDTFARSAAHAAQAQALLQEVAQDDLIVVGQPPRIVALQQLSAARLANVLRHWLRVDCQASASTVQLHELMRQIVHCTTRGHRIELKVGTGKVRRQGAVLAWYNP